ncbi:MAG: glycosyltransferase [Candidatus Shapirobacteria bacterium]|jgi:hypothetical protein
MTKEMITVVVNTYPHNYRGVDLEKCLDSLAQQSYRNFKVVLVENNVNQIGVEKIVKLFLNKIEVKVVVCSIKRLSVLFNIGWKEVKTEYVAFLADDAVADKDWLKNIKIELDKNERIAAVSGPVISSCYPTGEMHSLYLKMRSSVLGKMFIGPYIYLAMENCPTVPGKYFGSGAYSFGTALPESINFSRAEIDLLTTTSMGIKREVLDELGGFDEIYNFNHADGDLFLRIKQAEYKLIFSPKIKVKHMVRIGPSRNAYYIGKDTGIFHRKHLRPKSLRSLLGAVLNILVLNVYWMYSAVSKKDVSQLKGITGYVEGIFKT